MEKGSPVTSGGTIARMTAAITTTGVYQRAKRVMNASVDAFLSVASSTRERMRSTVDSS